MKEIRISDIIIPPFYSVFNNPKYEDVILTSGRAGTKSSYQAIDAIYEIVTGQGTVVMMRKNHNKLRNTVFPEVKRAIRRLGLSENDFVIRVSPMKVTYKATGASILFTGSDNPDDTKGMIDDRYPITLVVIDEVTEFFDKGQGEDELQNIKATFIRGNNDRFRMMYSFNPPKNPKAPVMTWLEKMKTRPNTLHKHVTYQDVPIEWLGLKTIETAEIDRDMDEKMYRWLWLGETTGLDELIFYMFNEERHVKRLEPHRRLIKVGVGVDYGQQNATTFQAFGIDIKEKKVVGIDEYYHSGRDEGQKAPSEYAKDFREFVQMIKDKYGYMVEYVVIDPSARGLAEEIKRATRLPIRPAKNEVLLGIERTQNLYRYNAIELNTTQKHLIEEKYLYSWDEKKADKGIDFPAQRDDHASDAERYWVMENYGLLSKLLPVLGER